jgi:glutamate dehydrogenase
VVDRFGELLAEHPLRRQIIATVVANEVINSEGITFVARLAAETGNEAPSIVEAYRIARIVTEAGRFWSTIEDLEGKLEPEIQHALLNGVDESVESAARWYLAQGDMELSPRALEATRAAFAELREHLPVVGSAEWAANKEERVADLAASGVPIELARRHVYRHAMVHAPDIVELARDRRMPLDVVAQLSFEVATAFQLDLLADRLADLPRTDRWQRAAARTVSDDLGRLRRQLTEQVVEAATDALPAAAVDAFVARHQIGHERLLRLMRSVALEGGDDVAALVVAVRRIESIL